MGHWTQSIAVDGAPAQPEGERNVYFNAVSPKYFHTLGIRLLRGRSFARADTDSAPKVVIVNETLARRYFGAGDPVGRRISIGRHASRQDLQIVGIVSDAKYQRLQEVNHSIAYLPCAQLFEMKAGVNLVAEIRVAAAATAVADHLKHAVRALDAGVPVRIETAADRIDVSLVRERVIAILAVVLGLSALTLACAGLFGQMSYAVSRHRREIGLRLALGANRAAVLWTVLKESLAVAAVGIAIALPAAVVLGRFAQRFLFQITPLDPVSLLGSSVLLLTLAACAGLIPARRAARVDPAIALRTE
jgi:predicted permease